MDNEKPCYIHLDFACPYGCDNQWFKILAKTETGYNLVCVKCNRECIGVIQDLTEKVWKDVYVNRCENGFYDQIDPTTGKSASELTVVKGFTAHWLHSQDVGYFPRPELDKKEYPQPEVYEGRFSANGFYLSAIGRFGFVSDRIYVTPGESLKASCMYMHVFNGPKVGGGSRMGIVMGDGPFATEKTQWPKNGIDPFEDGAIKWGGWRGTYLGDTPNREWVKLETPEVQGGIDFVRLVVQFNADVAATGSHGHWDVFKLQAYTDSNEDADPVEPGQCSFDPSSILLSLQSARDEIEQAKQEILQALAPVVKITDKLEVKR